jgi:hypothetical protein
LRGDLAESFIYEQVYNSYILVINKNVTPRALRMEILEAVKEHDAKDGTHATYNGDLQ